MGRGSITRPMVLTGVEGNPTSAGESGKKGSIFMRQDGTSGTVYVLEADGATWTSIGTITV